MGRACFSRTPCAGWSPSPHSTARPLPQTPASRTWPSGFGPKASETPRDSPLARAGGPRRAAGYRRSVAVARWGAAPYREQGPPDRAAAGEWLERRAALYRGPVPAGRDRRHTRRGHLVRRGLRVRWLARIRVFRHRRELGSAFNFCFARVVGRPTLERLVARETLARLDRRLDTARSRSAMFLLFLLPGVPKDVLSYTAGFSGMPLLEFVVLSGLARSPALLASVLIGAGVSRGDYRSLLATAGVMLLAIGGYYGYRRSRRGRLNPKIGDAEGRPC